MSSLYKPTDYTKLLSNTNTSRQPLVSDYLTNFDPKTILKDQGFLNDVRDVMASQGQYFDNDEDMMDEFFSERTWREFNLGAATFGDAGILASAKASDDVRDKMGRIQEVYNRFPMFWQEGGRGFLKASSDAVPAMLLAPENLIPVRSAVLAGQVARAAGRSAVGTGAKVGAVSGLKVEAPIAAATSAINQSTDLTTGARDQFSVGEVALETALGGVAGAGLGGALGAIGGAVGGRIGSKLLAEFDVLKQQKEERLAQDPNADTGDIDTKMEEIQKSLQMQEAEPELDAEADPEDQPLDVTAEDYDDLDLNAMIEEQTQLASDIDDQFKVVRIIQGLQARNPNDPAEKEAIKEWRTAVKRRQALAGLKKAQVRIAELKKKQAKTTNPDEASQLEGEIAQLELKHRGTLKAFREKDMEALANEADDVPVELDTATGEAAARPDLPRTPQDAPETDSSMVDDTIAVDDLNQEAVPAPPEKVFDETTATPLGDALPEVEADPTPVAEDVSSDATNAALQIMQELDDELTPELVTSLKGNRQAADNFLEALNKDDPDYRLPDMDQVFRVLDEYIRFRDADKGADFKVNEGPKAIDDPMVKRILADVDIESIPSEQIKDAYRAQVVRAVSTARRQIATAQGNFPEIEKIYEALIRNEALKFLPEAQEEGVKKIAGTKSQFAGSDAKFFNPSGRVKGLGGTDRTGVVRSGDTDFHEQIKAKAKQNLADNEALKGKDKENASLYKDVEIKRIAPSGGMIRARQSATAKDARYVAGDILTYNARTDKFTIDRTGQGKRRQQTSKASLVDTLAGIEDDLTFHRTMTTGMASGKITPEQAVEVYAKRSGASTAPDAEVPGTVDSRKPTSTDENQPAATGSDEQEEVIKEMAKELGIPREDITPVSLDEYDAMFKMDIPEGRTYAIREKAVMADGTEVFKYRRASIEQTKKIRNGELTVQDALMGRAKNREWEIGHVDEAAGYKFNSRDLDQQFAPIGKDAPVIKEPTPIEKTNEIPVIDLDTLADDPELNAKYLRVNQLQSGKFSTNVQDYDKHLDDLEKALNELPEYRKTDANISEQISRLQQILQGNNVPLEDMAGALDVFRRMTRVSSRGAPTIQRSGETRLEEAQGPSGGSAFYAMPSNELAMPKDVKMGEGYPQYQMMAHEMFHWAYDNVLSNEDKVGMYKALRKYYSGKDGKLDVDKIQAAMPIPITKKTAKAFLRPSDGSSPKTVFVMSSFSPQEFLASQFELYANGQLPYADTVFQKVARFITEVMERLMGKKSLQVDPDLMPYFAKLLPETSVDFMATTKSATTPEGLMINRIMDGLNQRRFQLEDIVANEYDINPNVLRSHQQALSTLLLKDGSDDIYDPFITQAMRGDDNVELKDRLDYDGLDEPSLKEMIYAKFERSARSDVETALETPAGEANEAQKLMQANLLLEVYDLLDERLRRAFLQKEGANAPDPDMVLPDLETVDPNTLKGMGSKEDFEKRARMREGRKAFVSEWREASASGNNQQMASVLEQFGEQLVYKHTAVGSKRPFVGEGSRLENWITTKYMKDKKAAGRMKRALRRRGEVVSELMYSIAGRKMTNRFGQPNDEAIAKYAAMTPEEYRDALEMGYKTAMEWLRRADIRLSWKMAVQEKNAKKKAFSDMRRNNKQKDADEAAKALAAANSKKSPQQEKPATNTPKDAGLRSEPKKKLLEELRGKNTDEARYEDIGAELARRVRAAASVEEASVSADTLIMNDQELTVALGRAMTEKNKEKVAEYAYEIWWRNDGKSVLNKGPRQIKLANMEAEMYRGASEADGVPNNTNSAVRDAVKKITHRDKETQRTGRIMLTRLLNMSDGDKLRLTSGEYDNVRKEIRKLASGIVKPNQKKAQEAEELLTFGGTAPSLDPNNPLDAALANLAGTLKGPPADTIRGISDIAMRAVPLNVDEAAAIRSAYDAAGSPDVGYPNPADASFVWFKDTLNKAILGEESYRPFRGADATTANNVLQSRIEDIAYLTNGLIKDPSVKTAAKRLSWYGDIFDGLPTGPSAERALKEQRFVEGGLGAGPNGESIAFYHATPNTKAFADQDFVFEPSGDNAHYGRGIYSAMNVKILDRVYSVKPTTAALKRMIATQVPEQDQPNALLLLEALQDARVNQMDADQTKRGSGEWPFIDDEIMEALEFMGLRQSPGVVEMRIRAVNPLDLRQDTILAPNDVDFVNVMMNIEADGGLNGNSLDYINGKLADGNYNARDWYGDVIFLMQRDNDITEPQAKKAFTDTVEELGYDSLQVTEWNRPNDDMGNPGEVTQFDAVVIFDSANVKNKDAKEFDPDYVQFNRAPQRININTDVDGMDGPLNAVTGDLLSDPNASVEDIIDGVAGRSGNGADPGLIDIMRKMAKRQALTEKDMRKLSEYNPLKILTDNANRLRMSGMHWVGDWAKPRKGASYHDRESALMASKVMPILDRLNEIGDQTKFRRWTRGLKFTGKVSQPDSFKRIVKAMRRPTSTNEKALEPKERGMVVALREAFREELRLMKEAGIRIGEIRDNYFPQVWNVEKIRENPARFEQGLTAYLLRENQDKPEGLSIDRASDIARQISDHLLNEDGVYLPKISKRANQNDNIDFTRLIRLNEIGDDGKLKYENILKFMEDNEFLVDDLQSIVAKYFEGTTRRVEMHKKFGTSNHGFYDYLAVRSDGERTAKKMLASDRTVTSTRLHLNPDGPGATTETARIPEIKALSDADANTAIDNALILIQEGKGPTTVAAYLKSLKPDSGDAYKRRVEAIANGLWEYNKFGKISRGEIKFAEQYMGTIQGKTVEETAYFNKLRKFSKVMRTINTVSLLGFTTLTSFTDVALPFIRGASAVNAYNALKNAANGPDGDEYRKALRSVGATMENIVQHRMAMMYGGTGGKISNAFFHANLLTPWTNMMRESAVMVGYEMLKANIKIAQKHQASGINSRKFRRAKRMLSEFGLDDYITNGKSPDDLSLLYEDTRLRAALHKFASESIFTPSRTDVPLWAQDTSEFGAIGAMIFQLKSYPLMFQRLTARTLKEAYGYIKSGGDGGDILPLVNMLTIGGLSGAGALAAKDLVQARGGDDERSVALRRRSLQNIAESMGYDKDKDDLDEWLGWAVESYVHMGGLGLVADLFYSASRQMENGMYGINRMNSLVLGPSMGALTSALTVAQGTTVADGLDRSAARELAQRIPIFGGVRNIRDEITDYVGGPPRQRGGRSELEGLGGGLGGGLS